jgi:hypothetical protein
MLTVLLPKEIPPFENELGQRNKYVLRLSCGEKFYIAKTINYSWMIEEIKKTYSKYLKVGIPENNLFYPLIRHLYKHEISTIKVEVLFASTNGYQVLKFELQQLADHFGKKDCLNQNNIPHIPKSMRAKKGSNWLSVNEELNFRKLLKNYSY